jgi:hypothetical protein
MAGEKPIRGHDLVLIDLIVGGFDVDERKLSLVRGSEARKHLALVDLISAPGNLLATVSTLS